MLQQQVDLETLQFILSQFNEDIADDCLKIIAKLLKSLSVSVVNDSRICYKKVFASIKILLNLYDCLNPSSANTESELPINIIIENVKLFFQCSHGNCNVPENEVQLNILSIISSVFKNKLLQNSPRDLEELAEFYEYNLISISTSSIGKECRSDCLIFKLKIMTMMYQVLSNSEFGSLNIEFCEKIKSVNRSREWKFIADLALHEEDGVAFQTLFHLIPAQINCFKSSKIIEVIWKQILTSLSCGISHFKVLTILCQIFDFFFDKSLSEGKVNLCKLIFEDVNYWKLIQCALKDKDPIKRKQGLYLFKNTIDKCSRENKNLFCGNEKYIFYWDLNCKDELYQVYSEIILILEFLEEQQIHIIKPIFKLIDKVSEMVLNSCKVNFSWILLIYQKVLFHESLQVVKWGLSSLLKLQKNFFLDQHIARESPELLAAALNNLSLYLSDGLIVSKELKIFFDRVSHLSTSKIFFSTFIKKLCSQIWSAEALFFVIHSLSNDKCPGSSKFPFWGKEEISEVITFVLKAFKTHNKIIRTGVQTNLLKACLNFIDEKDVALENFIFLISIFFDRETMKISSENWDNLILWLKVSYNKEDAKNILHKYVTEKSINKPKFMSLMFILFYYTYDSNLFWLDLDNECLKSHDKNMFVLNYFQEILLSYKDIHKRPYCNKKIHDENLSVICDIYQAHLKNSVPEFVKPTLPFLKDVIVYVQTQLSQISDLQDFNEMELYLNAFKNITATLILFKFDIEYANHLYLKILKDLESSMQSNSKICSMGMVWRVRILNIMLELDFLETKPSFLDFYLLKTMNESLRKDKDYSDKTRDLLALWGKLNSEFLEQKWKILNYLINNKTVLHGGVENKNKCWISNHDLKILCIEALNFGGYKVLCPVLSIFKNVLPEVESNLEVRKIIDLVWKLILEKKKTEEFKVFIRKFVEMVFQEVFFNKGEPMKAILLEYTNSIFSESSIAVVNIFMRHVQGLEITKSVALFCFIIGKGLIFGAVEKKAERLTKTVCSHIEFFETCNDKEIIDYNTSNEVRARAVQKITQLDKKSVMHQAIAKQLIDTLLEMESELNKNRTRYFGNSQVHRVKHRLMQALLVLEPILDENSDQAIKLSQWVIHNLISENSQPSVRYMQEWLIVRMIVRHSQVYSSFQMCNYNESREITKKGACSLIAVTYHMCRLIPSDLFEARAASFFYNFLFFCFHQHFELRLYAQVIFLSFYDYFAKSKVASKAIEHYKGIYDTLRRYIREDIKKNKNLSKLSNSFYFKYFHPLNNYSLETIYNDFPRLTDVGSDEWISTKMFQYCGVKTSETNVPLEDTNSSLKIAIQDTWLLKKFEPPALTEIGEKESEKFLNNYQKKIIPVKSLIPGWTTKDNEDNFCRNTVQKDGLIVVASLIDRLPNLGGLARTCEVFGASEYIINSLKNTENKQFTSLSVTAEKWITIKEIRIQNLLKYISEMKQSGYTIVGAEQALYSQPLHAIKFPKKSLLLLGNEKEGIPPNLLPLLDVCVEIPQLGLIRSLNVHVTGALFIWEYAKQHHFT